VALRLRRLGAGALAFAFGLLLLAGSAATILWDVQRSLEESLAASYQRNLEVLTRSARLLEAGPATAAGWDAIVIRARNLGLVGVPPCPSGNCLCPGTGRGPECLPLESVHPAGGARRDLDAPVPPTLRIADGLATLALALRPRTSRQSTVVLRGGAAALVHIERIDEATEAARIAIAARLPLYLAAFAAPLLLLGSLGWALSRERARTLVAERRRAEAERDAAVAARRVYETALKDATATLEDLGHEVLSPASSLRHALGQLETLVAERPEWRGVAERAPLDLMAGYVSRIVRAAERARAALQLRRRQAQSVGADTRIELNRFFARRLAAEQLIAPLPFRLIEAPRPIEVLADRGDLEEMVGNLLSNARRFAGDQPITVRLESERPIVRISIRNEGPIIPRGEEERIFELDVSLDPSAEETSHGLGLYLVRAAVNAMNGSVVAVNDPEPATHGVTFVIELLEAG
jgi:signal transduction histidine kinase